MTLTDQEIDEIIREFGLAEGDLDEAVYEACNETASQKVNSGEHDGPGFEDGYEQLHNDADRSASSINNRGLAGQLTFLSELCDTKAALQSLLKDL